MLQQHEQNELDQEIRAQWVSKGSKGLSSEVGKKLIDEGIKHAPEFYKLGTSKIKNRSVKKSLESDVADYIVKEAQRK